jgi:propionate CoA-transferase
MRVRCAIGGHGGLCHKLQKLAMEDKIEAYNLLQGFISHMYRDIVALKLLTITTGGLETFVDHRKAAARSIPSLPKGSWRF